MVSILCTKKQPLCLFCVKESYLFTFCFYLSWTCKLASCNLTLSSGKYLLCSLLYNHMILFFPQFYNITSNHNNDTQNASTLFIYPGKYDDHVLIFFSPSVPSTKHTTYTTITSHHFFEQLTRQVYTKTDNTKKRSTIQSIHERFCMMYEESCMNVMCVL